VDSVEDLQDVVKARREKVGTPIMTAPQIVAVEHRDRIPVGGCLGMLLNGIKLISTWPRWPHFGHIQVLPNYRLKEDQSGLLNLQMRIIVFCLPAILSLPKKVIAEHLGVKESCSDTKLPRELLAMRLPFAVMWYVFRQTDKVKLQVLHDKLS
jgi:hypothetical protein